MKIVRWVLVLPVSLIVSTVVNLIVWSIFDFLIFNNPFNYWVIPIIAGIAHNLSALPSSYLLAPSHKVKAQKVVQFCFIVAGLICGICAYLLTEWQILVWALAVIATGLHCMFVSGKP